MVADVRVRAAAPVAATTAIFPLSRRAQQMEVVSLIRRMARRALARAGSPARRGARAGRATAPPVARFETRSHQGRGYKLFVPSGANASRRLPLVVMLHGCRQDPDLFARDTHVNERAEVEGFLVVYPEQSAAHNGRRCGTGLIRHTRRAAGASRPRSWRSSMPSRPSFRSIRIGSTPPACLRGRR